MKCRLKKDQRKIYGSNGEGKMGNSHTEITNPSSFYRLMVTPTIQFKKLRLPETFTSAFCDQLSDACHLTVPTGKAYQVALIKEHNKLWFHDGWEKFVRRFSIGYGYFIAFYYNGNSNFSVRVFDLTACEISYDECDKGIGSLVQYGHFPGDLNPECPEEIQSDDCYDVGLENFGSDDLNDLDSNHKKTANVEAVELATEDDEIELKESSVIIADTVKQGECSQWSAVERQPWLMNYEIEMEVIAAAGICIPANPFFVALIRPYWLSSNGVNLCIPRAFCHRHMKCKAGDCIKVFNMSHEKKWLIRCCKSHLSYSLGKGWIKFARDVCLDVGDVCLFELIDAKNLVFKVHIVKTF